MPVNLYVCMQFNLHVMQLICGYKDCQTTAIFAEMNKRLWGICLGTILSRTSVQIQFWQLACSESIWRRRDPKTLGLCTMLFFSRVPILLVSLGHLHFQCTLQTVSQSRRFSVFIAYDWLRLCHLCCCELSSRLRTTKDESVTSNVLWQRNLDSVKAITTPLSTQKLN